MIIYIGADHAGYESKEKLKAYLTGEGHEVIDKGASSFNPDDDYPDFVKPVAEAVAKDVNSMGIIIGGSGAGEAMCANRVKGARAFTFYGPMFAKAAVEINGRESKDPYEIVNLARAHNNANIISLGNRFLNIDQIYEAVRIFLHTPFAGDARHVRRINKLDN